jgi:hypothetical protein
MNPTVSFQNVDVVTNRNSLRKLFNFISGRSYSDFRIDIHMVKNTLFLTRREKNIREVLHGSQGSFGHGFERACVTQSEHLQDSTAHHRVISYLFGGIRCVVRFEVDAYKRDCGDPPKDSFLSQNEDIIRNLGNLALEERPILGSTRVVRRGFHVPSDATLEVKSRSKALKIQETMPQLWFSRTPLLICGYHTNGVFEKVQEYDYASKFQEWEDKHQRTLRKLAWVLQEVRSLMSQSQRTSGVLVYTKQLASLKIYSCQESNGVLPDDIISRYWGP